MGFEDDINRNLVPPAEGDVSDNVETEASPADLVAGETATVEETKDAQRIQEINRIFDEVSWYSEGGKLRLAAACKEFVQPYQAGGEAFFSELMKDQELMPKTLEALQNIFLFISEFSSSEHTVRDNPEVAHSLIGIKNFLSLEVAFELENIDVQDQEQNNADAERTNQNNAFYVVSEVLGAEDVEKRKAVEQWLGDHIGALLENDPFKSSAAEGASTTVLRDALRNILLHATDPTVRDWFLKITLDLSEKDSYDGALMRSDTYIEVIQPILNRKFRSMPTMEESLFQLKQKRIAKMIAGKLGLDPSIVEKWEKARGSAKKDDEYNVRFVGSYEVNLRAAENLELESPGSAKRLFDEYGIANFGRYDMRMLLHQLEISDKDVPYGVVVYPEADWNGAFFQTADQLAEASLKLRMGKIETRIIEVGSQRELARRLITLDKKYAPNGNKIAFAIFGGHGTERSVTFGENKGVDQDVDQVPPPLPNLDEQTREEYQADLEVWMKSLEGLNKFKDKGYFSSDDILEGKGIQRASREFFNDAAPIVLVSCSTGMEGGIAEKSSNQLGWDISAPDIPTNLEKIDVTFDVDGKPVFDVKYNRMDGANTNRYVAGEKIESSK